MNSVYTFKTFVKIIDLNNIAHSISPCIIGFNLAFLCFA